MAAAQFLLQDAGRERAFFPRWIHACEEPFEREAVGGVSVADEATASDKLS